MSEKEKLQRDSYQKRRKRLIKIQSATIILLTILFLLSLLSYYKVNKKTVVPYSESGNVIHRAYLKDNDFYDDSYLNGSHAYVASLIEKMTADFTYDLEMSADDVRFQYTYRIDAQIEIKDRPSNTPIFNPTENILPQTTEIVSGRRISIKKLVEFDYNAYNKIANDFVTSYNLKNTSSALIVRMYVDVLGVSESFVEDNSGQYVTELHLPLLDTTVKPYVSTTAPVGTQTILASDTSAKSTAIIIAAVLGALTLICSLGLAIYTVLSRDKHIDYSRRVERLVRNYKSYIQKILDEYDTQGCQVIRVEAFTELLEIRDTIRQPVFMYENEDKTCTRFFVVTSLMTVYIYEVKVEEDSIINLTLAETPAEDVLNSTVTENGTREETAAENVIDLAEQDTAPAEQSEPILEYVIDEAEIQTPSKVEVRYRRSFMSRLIQSTDDVKSYYSEIKNELLCYKGVKTKISWFKEVFRNKKTPVAKMDVKGKTLYLYLSITPHELEGTKYRITDVSDKHGGAEHPTLLKIKNERGKKQALELISLLMNKLDCERVDRANEDFAMPYEDTEALIERGLIKVLLPKGAVIDENTVTVKISIPDFKHTPDKQDGN